MAQYSANSINSRNFSLTFDNKEIGQLIYKKWYSIDAEIRLANGKTYQIEPRGFWDSKIELKDETRTLLEFTMGWKGIIIKSMFDNDNNSYLLKLKGFLDSRFVLLDTHEKELLVAQTNLKWNKLNYDYAIETYPDFDKINNKEMWLLTILHCINYYMSIIASGG